MDGFFAEEFTIKQGDRLPAFAAVVVDGDGEPVDISAGATARFKMRPAAGGAVKVNAVATIVDDGSEELRGHVRYDWAALDTDTAGDFDAEVEVTSAGLALTFPNHGYQRVVITDDI